MSAEVPEPGEINDSRTGVMTVRVGGRAYPARHVPQCKVCRSKYRSEIEQAIIGGMTYAQVVAETVTPFDNHSPLGTPSLNGVMNHVKNKHMPVPFSTQRMIIEERARELGKPVEEGEQILLDNVAISRTIVQKGFDRLNKGEIEPSMGDLLKALQIQAQVGVNEGGGLGEDVWREALMEYMAIVQRSVSLDAFNRIKHEMANSPVLAEIALRRRQMVVGEIEG